MMSLQSTKGSYGQRKLLIKASQSLLRAEYPDCEAQTEILLTLRKAPVNISTIVAGPRIEEPKIRAW